MVLLLGVGGAAVVLVVAGVVAGGLVLVVMVIGHGRGVGVVARAYLVVVGREGRGRRVLGQRVGVLGGRLALLEEPDEAALAAAVARRVVVGRRGAKALLLAAVAHQHHLDEDGEDEENLRGRGRESVRQTGRRQSTQGMWGGNTYNGDNGDGQTRAVHAARRVEGGQVGEAVLVALGELGRGALAEDGVGSAVAVFGAAAVGNGHVDVGADEGDVEGHGDDGRGRVAGEAAQQQQGCQRVQNANARDTLNSARPRRYSDVVVVQRGQEVAEQRQDQRRAAELDAADEPLQELQRETAACTHGVCVRVRRLCAGAWTWFGKAPAGWGRGTGVPGNAGVVKGDGGRTSTGSVPGDTRDGDLLSMVAIGTM